MPRSKQAKALLNLAAFLVQFMLDLVLTQYQTMLDHAGKQAQASPGLAAFQVLLYA